MIRVLSRRGEIRWLGGVVFPRSSMDVTRVPFPASTPLPVAFRSISRRGRPPPLPWAGFVFHDAPPRPSFRASQILPWEGRRGRAIQPPDDLLGLCLIRSSPVPTHWEFLLSLSPSPMDPQGALLLPSHRRRGKPTRKHRGGGVAQREGEGRSGKRGSPRYPYLRLHRPPLQRTRPWIRHGRTRRRPRPLRTHVPRQTSSWKPAAGETCRTRGRTRRKDGRRTPRTGTGETPRIVDVQCEAKNGWNVKNVVLTRCEGRCATRGSDPTIDTTD